MVHIKTYQYIFNLFYYQYQSLLLLTMVPRNSRLYCSDSKKVLQPVVHIALSPSI